MLVSVGCSEPYLGVKIPVTATWGGDPIACGNAEPGLTDLRLYLSSFELVDTRGAAHSLRLHEEIPWQQADLALLDLENGQGPCNSGTPDTYAYVVGSAPPGDYVAMRFTLGVPFERNHANPLTAAAPLDDPAMHWHWRSGYKFMRAGVRAMSDGFWMHLGSAGCEGTVRNISSCRFPNRVDVHLDAFEPNRDAIELDLKALFGGVDLSDGVPGDCSSGPAELSCVEPFAALGIDFRTGRPTGTQIVFSSGR